MCERLEIHSIKASPSSSGLMPIRDMPVSTFTCTGAFLLSLAAQASKASIASLLKTAGRIFCKISFS